MEKIFLHKFLLSLWKKLLNASFLKEGTEAVPYLGKHK